MLESGMSLCNMVVSAHRVARAHASSLLYGASRSMVKGMGLEYMDFRDYVYGDDVKYVDWRLSARTIRPDGEYRLIVKEYEAERMVHALMILDLSSSMGFGSKLWSLAYAASLVAYTAGKLEDTLSLAILGNNGVRLFWRISPAALPSIVEREVCRTGVGGEAGLTLAERIVARLKPRSPVLLFMDYDHVPGEIVAISKMAWASLLPFHAFLIVDPNEVAPPLPGALAVLVDPERGLRSMARLSRIYSGIQMHVKNIRATLRSRRINYLELRGPSDASSKKLRIIHSYLRARANV